MLTATQKLAEIIGKNPDDLVSSLVEAYAYPIAMSGSTEDATLLTRLALSHPAKSWTGELFEAIAATGNTDHGEQLLHAFVHEGTLLPGTDERLLLALGKLQVIAAYPMLWQYALHARDHYESKYAVFGLLATTDTRPEEIKVAVNACLGQHLFPEFVPALVSKLPDREDWLPQLYALGCRCSTDCNAGLLVAFSLCGDAGKDWYLKAIFNPDWEAGDSATGTLHYTWQGMKALNLRFADLADSLSQLAEPASQDYACVVIYTLLQNRLEDPDPAARHTGAPQELYDLLFSESEDSLFPIVGETLDMTLLLTLETQLLDAIRREYL